MKLRLLTSADEADALQAHTELARENFEFLLGYEPGMSWQRFLDATENARAGRNLPSGWVPATFLVAEQDDRIVGRVSIRHELNDFLRTKGGHIGYGVRPQFRGRGMASRMLAEALPVARQLGIRRLFSPATPTTRRRKRR